MFRESIWIACRTCILLSSLCRIDCTFCYTILWRPCRFESRKQVYDCLKIVALQFLCARSCFHRVFLFCQRKSMIGERGSISTVQALPKYGTPVSHQSMAFYLNWTPALGIWKPRNSVRPVTNIAWCWDIKLQIALDYSSKFRTKHCGNLPADAAKFIYIT